MRLMFIANASLQDSKMFWAQFHDL